MLLGACDTAVQQSEEFPPIVCSVTGGGGQVETTTAQIDGEPGVIQAGDLTFAVDYRSGPDGRTIETSVQRASGEVIERVTYVVSGRTSLRNQFGSARAALTGEHELHPERASQVRWRCSVGVGE